MLSEFEPAFYIFKVSEILFFLHKLKINSYLEMLFIDDVFFGDKLTSTLHN